MVYPACLAVAGLFTVVVAVRGKTWNEKAHGWRQVTNAGWLSIFIGSITAVLTIACARDELKEVASDRQREADRFMRLVEKIDSLGKGVRHSRATDEFMEKQLLKQIAQGDPRDDGLLSRDISGSSTLNFRTPDTVNVVRSSIEDDKALVRYQTTFPVAGTSEHLVTETELVVSNDGLSQKQESNLASLMARLPRDDSALSKRSHMIMRSIAEKVALPSDLEHESLY